MTLKTFLWNYLKNVPAGIWAALAVGGVILGLYLRGKRLQAELVKAKFQASVAEAEALTARNQGAAAAHLGAAQEHAQNAAVIETAITEIQATGQADLTRLHAMSAAQVTEDYLKLFQRGKP